MYRILLCRLAILLGFFSSTNLALAQVHPAQPHQLTFAEALAAANALQNSNTSFVFSASGKSNVGPWSIFEERIVVGGSAVQLSFPYYFIPIYPYPTAEPPQTPVLPSPGSRPAWLDTEEPRQTAPPAVERLQRNVSEADRTKAEKSLAQGDASFARQKYSAAVERYRSAARLAPDWADPHFRRGFALVATGDYSGAVAAFRAGLKLRSDWSASQFRLDTIYAEGALEKTNQKIAQRLGRDPLDRDLLFAKGMQLFFAGEQQRSRMYLSQAASLEATKPGLLEAFLAPLDAATRPK